MAQVILPHERQGILELVLNQPAKHNDLSEEMIEGLNQAAECFANCR
jgi:enoyl-CoA hydratase/carnithine racemase